MTILLLANHLNTGGITAYLFELCRSLHGRDGIRMAVASRGGDREEDFAALGVRCLRVPLTTKCEVSPKVFWSYARLIGPVRALPVDVLHANTRVTQVLAALLSRRSGVPYVSTCHGYFKPRLSRRLLPCWGRKVVAISEPVRRHLVEDFGVPAERVVLIRHGIDLGRFGEHGAREKEALRRSWGLPDDKRIVGHIGRLSSVKGQIYFLKAAQELLSRRNDLCFLLIGDGPEKEALRAFIEKEGLGPHVRIVASTHDMSLTLSLMEVFVMPSIEEGLGLSVLEAQAQGVPVVASGVGGLRDIIEDGVTGRLVPPRDVAGLSRAVEAMLDDAGAARAMAAEARRRTHASFSSQRMAEATRALYASARKP
ncbi:MAG: glycosyltransferase family 4 protein [Deltaproteobacteria bacterium]